MVEGNYWINTVRTHRLYPFHLSLGGSGLCSGVDSPLLTWQFRSLYWLGSFMETEAATADYNETATGSSTSGGENLHWQVGLSHLGWFSVIDGDMCSKPTLVCEYVDTLMQCYVHTLMLWYIDMLIRWSTEILIRWYIDMWIHWYVDALICWYIDMLIH